MTLDPEWLRDTLEARMPRVGPRTRLDLVSFDRPTPDYAAAPTGRNSLGLWACLRLTKGDGPGSSTAICVLVAPKELGEERTRAEAYLDGWLEAVDQVLADAAPQVVRLVAPTNLACPAALALARPKTAAEFRAAVLAPKRLGKLLGDPVAAMRSLDAGRA